MMIDILFDNDRWLDWFLLEQSLTFTKLVLLNFVISLIPDDTA